MRKVGKIMSRRHHSKHKVIDLKPENACPQCGGRAKTLPQIEVEKGQVKKIPEFFFCQCSSCGTRTERFYRHGEYWKTTRNRAVKAWNEGILLLSPAPRS